MNRFELYIREKELKIIRKKAQKYNLSVSRFIVLSALGFELNFTTELPSREGTR